MKWIIPKRRGEEIAAQDTRSDDFNGPLLENGGGECVVETPVEVGRKEADEDIRQGRVKKFDNPDDMIESLNQPW